MIQTEQIPQDGKEMNGVYPGMSIVLKTSSNTLQCIGLRDIFVVADASAVEIIDKKTTKEKTTKLSNAEYKPFAYVSLECAGVSIVLEQ
ncbi:hypothetical protein RMATCC62417_15720 [Rhizopus microsporus]|nr:hypothetical protein RMATCC62417_15720 [Rhizopus microsporus]